jgi:hypothetical protein
MHVYLHILHAHAKFRKKQTFYVACVKRQKRVVKTFILVPNFNIFT